MYWYLGRRVFCRWIQRSVETTTWNSVIMWRNHVPRSLNQLTLQLLRLYSLSLSISDPRILRKLQHLPRIHIQLTVPAGEREEDNSVQMTWLRARPDQSEAAVLGADAAGWLFLGGQLTPGCSNQSGPAHFDSAGTDSSYWDQRTDVNVLVSGKTTWVWLNIVID